MSASSSTSTKRRLDLQVSILVCPTHEKCSLGLAMEGDVFCLTDQQRLTCANKMLFANQSMPSREALETLEEALQYLKCHRNELNEFATPSFKSVVKELERQICTLHGGDLRPEAETMLNSLPEIWGLNVSSFAPNVIWTAFTNPSRARSCTCPSGSSFKKLQDAIDPGWHDTQGMGKSRRNSRLAEFPAINRMEDLQSRLDRFMIETEAVKEAQRVKAEYSSQV